MNDIYFLEWIAQASGFSEEQLFLQFTKPYIQKEPMGTISERYSYYLNKSNKIDWLMNGFYWDDSFLKPNHEFWSKIDNKWREEIKHLPTEKIWFSKRNFIELWDLYINKKKDIPEKIKVKEKKLKI